MTFKLVLIRHGESQWNLENRFTGWTDVDLTAAGLAEARAAGALLRDEGFEFDLAFTSVLKRAIRTLWSVLDEMDRMWLPVVNDWRLNERHYGALQGLNKAETAKKLRRRAGTDLAACLCGGARAAARWRSARIGFRPALRLGCARTDPAHRVPEGHGRPGDSLLARDDRPRRRGGQARAGGGARQFAARTGQAPRQRSATSRSSS